jgi:hypothetical protein
MHGPINVKSPNNTSKWKMGFNSAFKGLMTCYCRTFKRGTSYLLTNRNKDIVIAQTFEVGAIVTSVTARSRSYIKWQTLHNMQHLKGDSFCAAQKTRKAVIWIFYLGFGLKAMTIELMEVATWTLVKAKERHHFYTLCMKIYLQVNYCKHENHKVLAGFTKSKFKYSLTNQLSIKL